VSTVAFSVATDAIRYGDISRTRLTTACCRLVNWRNYEFDKSDDPQLTRRQQRYVLTEIRFGWQIDLQERVVAQMAEWIMARPGVLSMNGSFNIFRY
jgi:hypothetical protein